MIKSLVAFVACVVLALTLSVAYVEGQAHGATVTQSSATQEAAKATPGCAGKKEYRWLHVGISRRTTSAHFDADGHYEFTGEDNYWWSWRACWAMSVKRVWAGYDAVDGLLRTWKVRHV